jgi:hypothetical protein
MNLWRVENGALRLRFHSAQSRVMQSTRRFVFMIAGSQSGKTTFGPWWLYREIYGGGGYDGHGAGDYLAVTATYDLFKLKMLPVTLETFIHLTRSGRYWSGVKIIELRDPVTGKFWATRADDPMWGRIILRSAQSPGGLEAATAKAAWLDECGQDAFSLEAWEAVLRRVSLTRGRVLGTTTPYNLGWLKTEVHDEWRDGNENFDVVQFASNVNPSFPKEEFSDAWRRTAAWKFDMFYRGIFARPANLIYIDFDVEKHRVDDFAIPQHWPRYVGIDFGAVHTALIWLAEDVDTGIFYLYKESLEGNLTTKEHAARALEQARGVTVRRWSGGSGSEKQERMDWASHGVRVMPPVVNDVETGIDRVIQLIREDRLRVFRSCKGTLDEFGTYSRDIDKAGETTEEIRDKRKFHRMDALRYVVQSLPVFMRYAASAYAGRSGG